MKQEGASKPKRAVTFAGTKGATIAEVLADKFEYSDCGYGPRDGRHQPHIAGTIRFVERGGNRAFFIKYDGLWFNPRWEGNLGANGEGRTGCPYCLQVKNTGSFLPVWDEECDELKAEEEGYVPVWGDAFDLMIRGQALKMRCEECEEFEG